MIGEVVHDEDVPSLGWQVFLAFNDVIDALEQPAEFHAAPPPDLFWRRVFRRRTHCFVDLLKPAIDLQFLADVFEKFEAHPRETGLEWVAVVAEKLERLKRIGQSKPALEINGQRVQGRADAELGGAFLE